MTGRSGQKKTLKKSQTRRDFLKHITRLGLGGALGVLGFSLLGRIRGDKNPLSSCVNDFYCRTCDLSGGCNLPQALSFRRRFGG
jgi:hypothetical protein